VSPPQSSLTETKVPLLDESKSTIKATKASKKSNSRNTMRVYTGEHDKKEIPETDQILDWWLFNTDLYSSDRNYSEVSDICERFGTKKVDLRPYMIEQPYVVHTCDSLP